MQALSNGKTFTLSEGIVATLKKGLAFVFLTQEYISGNKVGNGLFSIEQDFNVNSKIGTVSE